MLLWMLFLSATESSTLPSLLNGFAMLMEEMASDRVDDVIAGSTVDHQDEGCVEFLSAELSDGANGSDFFSDDGGDIQSAAESTVRHALLIQDDGGEEAAPEANLVSLKFSSLSLSSNGNASEPKYREPTAASASR